MRVTEKVQKTNAANTAKAHKTQIKALDKCISYNDKLRLMVLEVLREESGRELASVARFVENWQALLALTVANLIGRHIMPNFALTTARHL